MSFQHIIAGKIKLNGLSGMCHHLLDRDRVKTNPNIDLSRSHFNYCIEALSPENLNQRVKTRIKQLKLKKASSVRRCRYRRFRYFCIP